MALKYFLSLGQLKMLIYICDSSFQCFKADGKLTLTSAQCVVRTVLIKTCGYGNYLYYVKGKKATDSLPAFCDFITAILLQIVLLFKNVHLWIPVFLGFIT